MNQNNFTSLRQLKKVFFDERTTRGFISFLSDRAKVIAPCKKGENSYSFEYIQNPDEVVFDYPRTIQPLKKFFLPPRETLFNFNTRENSFSEPDIESEDRIFFGVHAYELQGLLRLDHCFEEGHPEYNYLRRRENTLFIGISYTPDDWHFSRSVGIEIEKLEGFCLYFEPLDSGFLVFIVNEAGKNLVELFGKGAEIDNDENFALVEKNFRVKIKFHHNRLPQVFENVYYSKVWEEISRKCLGCGTCNLLCPTCYCFDVRDEIELDATTGKRERFWDGCMLNSFALVAGGENFRDPLSSRTRHRLHRKFKYLADSAGDLFCVGCGRCSKYCPAKINIIDIINDLIGDFAGQQKRVLI